MEEFWILILVAFSVTNSRDKAESVQLEELEELPLQTFDEIFGEGWWDKDKADEWDKLTLEHNFHHEIDRQNTQLGQIEPNSTDQLGQIEPNSTDQLGQIEFNSTDQNPPLTVSDHSDNAKNAEDERKHEDIAKMLKIGSATLVRWKSQFKRQQFHPKSVDSRSI
uniref:Secreted protein n=1 Tax=Globodera rostochiensis TaxID=31243 RepID=A0A914H9C3_GLORO